MSTICPKGHASDAADYCSECGARMGAAAKLVTAPASAPASTSAGEPARCPDCGTPRASGARFCEVCRYNFETRSPWTASGAAAAKAAAPVPVAPPPAPAAVQTAHAWRVAVVVDPALYVEPDPAMPCPTNEPERIFPLDLAENLIGRPSAKKGIKPEVPVRDEGVSHRHAKLVRGEHGGFALLDLGSTNGTKLNGNQVQEGVPVPLADGDQITLGAWTRITVRAVGRS